ncbi:hypothetical protein JPSP45_21640 [Staphylococcus pseudintermedius]
MISEVIVFHFDSGDCLTQWLSDFSMMMLLRRLVSLAGAVQKSYV